MGLRQPVDWKDSHSDPSSSLLWLMWVGKTGLQRVSELESPERGSRNRRFLLAFLPSLGPEQVEGATKVLGLCAGNWCLCCMPAHPSSPCSASHKAAVFVPTVAGCCPCQHPLTSLQSFPVSNFHASRDRHPWSPNHVGVIFRLFRTKRTNSSGGKALGNAAGLKRLGILRDFCINVS